MKKPKELEGIIVHIYIILFGMLMIILLAIMNHKTQHKTTSVEQNVTKEIKVK